MVANLNLCQWARLRSVYLQIVWARTGVPCNAAFFHLIESMTCLRIIMFASLAKQIIPS